MSILSSLGSYSLDCGLSLIAPWHSKVGRMLKGRGETIARMQQMLSPERPTIWVHVSSLGEFEQGRPLIESENAIRIIKYSLASIAHQDMKYGQAIKVLIVLFIFRVIHHESYADFWM